MSFIIVFYAMHAVFSILCSLSCWHGLLHLLDEITLYCIFYIEITSWKVCEYDFYSRVEKYRKTNEQLF